MIKDFKRLADIWLSSSIKAHYFIAQNYWENNKLKIQQEYLPNAEIYVAEIEGNVYGFIALIENKVAAIFVAPNYQGRGIGRLLIHYAKKTKTTLLLHVYQDNKKSIKFYELNGFKILKEAIDDETKAKEFIMFWEKCSGE